MPSDFDADVALISRIGAIPTILEVVCRTTGMGFAAVARVTGDRWVLCSARDEIAFGLQPGGELKIETTICREVREHRALVVIGDVADDCAYRDHPTPALYGFQSYVSMPIVLADGTFFGTLCAIDPRPHRIDTPATAGMFKLFAELIAFHIDAHRRLDASDTLLADERQTADLREQFIAVLGHDLRNPLASIDAGARMLSRETLTDRGRGVLGMVRSSVGRMAGLIDDVLDFARGRLGGGLPVERVETAALAPMLRQVVDELRGAHPDRVIEAETDGVTPIRCDPGRLGQLLSNLVGNALTHGDPVAPIRIRGAVRDGALVLSVANSGEPIPPDTIDQLFEPFVRASSRPGQQGLGLGLYIASEIARAHDGTLTVRSTPRETCFTFRMPVG